MKVLEILGIFCFLIAASAGEDSLAIAGMLVLLSFVLLMLSAALEEVKGGRANGKRK